MNNILWWRSQSSTPLWFWTRNFLLRVIPTNFSVVSGGWQSASINAWCLFLLFVCSSLVFPSLVMRSLAFHIEFCCHIEFLCNHDEWPALFGIDILGTALALALILVVQTLVWSNGLNLLNHWCLFQAFYFTRAIAGNVHLPLVFLRCHIIQFSDTRM